MVFFGGFGIGVRESGFGCNGSATMNAFQGISWEKVVDGFCLG